MAPAVGPDPTVVPVLNGLRHLDLLNAAFGSARVLGGVALLATQDGPPTPAVERTGELLDGAGFQVAISDDILAAMWPKWAFVASAGAATCLLGGTAGEIVAADGAATARAIVDEAALIAAASGRGGPAHSQRPAGGRRTSPGMTAPPGACAREGVPGRCAGRLTAKGATWLQPNGIP